MAADGADRVAELEREWKRRNAPFSINGNRGPASGPTWSVTSGTRPLIMSAVHAVVHRRPDQPRKPSDANTGGLCVSLADAVGATAVVVLRSDETLDANRDPDHPIKRALLRRGLVGPGRFLLDLHGMSDACGFDIAIGRGARAERGDALATKAVECFTAHDFAVDPDGSATGLNGSGLGTVTSFFQGHGGEAIQIEIAFRNRTFHGASDRRHRLLEAMLELCAAIPIVGP